MESDTAEEHGLRVRVMMLWDHARCRPRTHYTVRRYIARCTCGWRGRPCRSEEAAFRSGDVHQGAGELTPYRRLIRP